MKSVKIIKTVYSRFIISFLIAGFITSAYSEDFSSTAVPEEIKVEYSKERSFFFPGLKRFLVMKPDMAPARRENDSIFFRGAIVGKTTLLVWIDRMYKIKLEVTPPVINISRQQKELEKRKFQEKMATFELNYYYTQDSTGRSYSELKRDPAVQNGDLSVKTPFFKSTRFEMRGSYSKPQSGDVDYDIFALQISNITWPKSQNYAVRYGNVTSRGNNPYTYSGTLKGVTIEPLRFNLWSDNHPLSITLFYGYQENKTGSFWSGYGSNYLFNTFSSYSLKSEEKIYLSRVGLYYSPRKPFFGITHSWKLDWAHTFKKSNTQKTKDVFDLDMQFKTDKKKGDFSFFIGGNLENLSYSAGYSKRFENIGVRIQKSVVTPGVESISKTFLGSDTDTMLLYYMDEKFAWHFFNTIYYGWNVVHSVKKNKNYQGETVEDEPFTNMFEIKTKTGKNSLNLSMLYSDDTRTLSPSKRTAYNVNYSGRHNLFFKGGWGLRHSYGEVQRSGYSLYDSEYTSYGATMSFMLLKSLTYSISQSYNNHMYPNLNIDNNSVSTAHSLSHYLSLFNGALNISSGYGYAENKYDKQAAFSSNVTDSHALNMGLLYNINEGTRFNVDYYLRIENREDDSYQDDRVRSQILASMTSKFGTLFGWKPKTEISVVTFEDKDGNGKYEADIDDPMEGIEILLNDKFFGVTDEFGELNLGKIKGNVKIVAADIDTMPKGYIFTTFQKYEFSKPFNSREKCYFGFAANTDISGTVYNDVNGNLRFDDEDLALSGVRVCLSSGASVVTDITGRYMFAMLPEGEYEVSIDPMSVPRDYVSTSSIKTMVRVEKGDRKFEDFSFRAFRMLKGTVYQFKNMSKKPVPGVKLQIGTQEKTTSEKGNFKFIEVPHGKVYLKVSAEGLSFKRVVRPEPFSFKPGPDGELIFCFEYTREPCQQNIEIILE